MHRCLTVLLAVVLLGGCTLPGVAVESSRTGEPLSETNISATVAARARATASSQPPTVATAAPARLTATPLATTLLPQASTDRANLVVAVGKGGIVSVLDGNGWSVPTTGIGGGCNQATAAFSDKGAFWVACVNSYSSDDGQSWQQPQQVYGDVAVYRDAAGRIWSLGVAAIHLREGDGWRSFEAADVLGRPFFPVGSAAFAPDGTAYFAAQTGDQLLVAFDGAGWKSYGADVGIAPSVGPETLLFGSAGLLAGAQGGVYRLDGERFTPFIPAELFAMASGNPSFQAPITALAEAPDGTLWIATSVGLFAYQAGQLRRIERADGLPSNQINALALDGAGQLWVATAHGLAVQTAAGWQVAVPSSSALGDSFLTGLAVRGTPALPAPEATLRTATIGGRVVAGGQPLPGATVELCSETPTPRYLERQASVCADQFYSQQTTTNERGEYRFANVPLGTYTLAATNAQNQWTIPFALDIPALTAGREYTQNLAIE